MNQKVSLDGYDESSAKQRNDNPFQFERIQMLVSMYFGALNNEWKELVRARNAANKLRPIIGSSLTAEHVTEARRREFDIEMNRFNDLGERFKSRLTALSLEMLINR